MRYSQTAIRGIMVMVVKLLSAYVLKNEKILIKLAVIMLFNSIILNSLYLLYNPGINDSFVLERLGMLTSHFEITLI